ncbi:MAG: RDD family protein [Lachnospiraceae bacterium]|nr:RDD family protein [Lachnospiraceae bacterium]
MQNQLENRVCAGFFVRLVAFAIDSFIAALIVGIVKLPFSFAPADSFLKANFLFDYSILDVFSYIGVAAYFVLLTYFSHSTPGKFLMGLEVITRDGSFTFINILYRETIGRFLSSLLCIGYFAVLVTKDHQGFHDMLCDTCVVYKNMMPVPKLKNVAVVQQESQPAEAAPDDVPASEEKHLEPSQAPVYYHTDINNVQDKKEPVKETYDNMNPDSTHLDIN